MTTDFVPEDFEPPTSLVTDDFVLEPLGPQHNESDHAAWSSSIAHIRETPGYADGSWPPVDGMSLEDNLADLTRHAADFEARRGFTFTVLEPGSREVIGCVYLYPSSVGPARRQGAVVGARRPGRARPAVGRCRGHLARERLALGASGPSRAVSDPWCRATMA